MLGRTALLCFDARVLCMAQERAVPGLALCLLHEDARPWPVAIAALGFQPDVFGPDYTAATLAAV